MSELKIRLAGTLTGHELLIEMSDGRTLRLMLAHLLAMNLPTVWDEAKDLPD